MVEVLIQGLQGTRKDNMALDLAEGYVNDAPEGGGVSSASFNEGRVDLWGPMDAVLVVDDIFTQDQLEQARDQVEAFPLKPEVVIYIVEPTEGRVR